MNKQNFTCLLKVKSQPRKKDKLEELKNKEKELKKNANLKDNS